MNEPLKASNLDRIRALEDRIAALERAARIANSVSASNNRQVQPVRVFNGVTNGGGFGKFTTGAGTVALDTRRNRNLLDTTRNDRPYAYQSHAFDNIGPNQTKAVAIPPHHDIEFFQFWLGAINEPFPAPGVNDTENTSFFRIPNQTKLTNLQTSTEGIQAVDPGTYLGIVMINIPIRKQLLSTGNYKSGTVRAYVSNGTVIYNQGQFLNHWSRVSSNASAGTEWDSILIHGWFLWRPGPLEELKWSVVFSDAQWIPNPLGYSPRYIGEIAFIELGRNQAISGVNYNGSTASTFAFSNYYAQGNTFEIQRETADAVVVPA